MKPAEKVLFICVWIRVLAKVTKVSSTFYDQLKVRIKEVKPNAFPRENIEDWYKALLPDLEQLLQAGKYEHVLTEHISGNLSMYCSAGGTFIHEVNQALGRARKAVAKVTHMPQDRADEYTEQQELGIKELLVSFVDLYSMELKET